ncbi:DUF2167 domain-containing protein [Xanthocytophaga agilis]|uniref:DUF2167 domain-containing protein n=1 Tax=Xanthocytophaga agilis TaxID=3048010 RepID=A0AAE3R3T4_9BACT|nr:DUF2167 domain-containing protein [Xanthocytophaga agilis]MDJ1503219.1 DUF2167 domain-containing protein [Xanthocytophaga agilis]
MRKNYYALVGGVLLFFISLVSQATDVDSTAIYQAKIDSIENSLKYQHGTIKLEGGIGEVTIPTGFKYLDPKQAEYVLTDLWGNPKQSTLGLIVPENQGVLGDKAWAFNIQYDEMGYVKDDDADDIDYEELLEEMQNDIVEASKERVAQGYEPIKLVGWANKPFYDEDRKILHWAKEIKFGDEEVNTLNYNVRVLGRKGVLVLNAIGSMQELPVINKNIDKVLNIVQFSDGYKYSDFNPDVDEVAAYTVGGLVAGKVLAKVGILAFVGKFFKIIAVAVIGGVSALWKWLTGRRKDDTELATATDETPTSEA